MQPNQAVFIPLLLASILFFAWSCYRRFSLVSLGRPEVRFNDVARRVREMLLYAFAQKRVAQGPFGFNHVVIFWSFVILLIANGEFMLKGMFPALSLSKLPGPVHHGLLVAFDLVSLLTLGSIALAFARRLFFPPAYLETSYMKARSGEAFFILSAIGLLMLAYYGLHGAEIALGSEEAAFMPVSSHVAAVFAGMSTATIESFGLASWWLHALVLLAFLNYLPHSKHMHILTAIPNCFFRSLEKPNTVPREDFAEEEKLGVGEVTGFTWKDLFDTYSCTECGRCQNACPATNTGKPLNPRQIVHDIKVNLLENAAPLRSGEKLQLPLIGDGGEGSNSEDSIWSCTTCGACMEACPVFIEQMPKIIKMRRHLVQMEARFPEELLALFENMEQRSNPWGIAPGERTKWAAAMDVKPFETGSTEYLFFVGCAGSFDARSKHVTVAIASVLDAAGISWGILGREENCCGDSLRRLGNEFVFDRIARENVALFQKKGVKKVITQCPHCFSTLRNDYRQYGLELEVVHHAELLRELLVSGRLKPSRQVADLGKVVFHDSCYLGRHNDVYDAPREVLAQTVGSPPLEMERNRNNSFCCGAGGGRMWMEEPLGTRINLARVREALVTNPDTVCVTCPYCMTMFEDGLKDEHAAKVRVKDLAEIVAEAVLLPGRQ